MQKSVLLIGSVPEPKYVSAMLLHLIKTFEVAFTRSCFSQFGGAFHLLEMVGKLCLWNGKAAELTLLNILHAVVVVQLKRFLRMLFSATPLQTKVRLRTFKLTVIGFILCAMTMCWNKT